MLILIDSADVDEIKKLMDKYPYDGVTTNPTILEKADDNPMDVLKRIKSLLTEGAQLHAQVISETAEGMITEAEHIYRELGKENTYVKIPVTTEGLKAMALLHENGIKNITATAIYTAMQAFMAAKAGARYTAPYVNRIDNLGANGVQTAKNIHGMFKMHNMESNVLAASFKNSQQVLELCLHGIGAITAAPDVLRGLVKHDSTINAVNAFNRDFHSLTNLGKTMLDY